ncbi:exonuclease [Onchocerca flexuosa]|uniref:RNA exonuclease 4 n=1 Tax=Onchocerca flexuosa TaxID=387005 RepID=A0A238BZW3_9BILA|nr:exonuclease [Onchocerca flexuosa]
MMALSTNWKQLREKLEQEKAKLVDEANNKPCNGSIISKHKKMARLAKKKAKRQRLDGERGGVDSRNSTLNDTESQKEQDELTNVLGLDCEYVGVGMDGGDNMLARISIVNMQGRCVYDKYVKPRENITDYRTAVSGIRPINLVNGEPFQKVQAEVHKLLSGRIVVGHSLKNDFKMTRDTARYLPFRKLLNVSRTPSLKLLAKQLLGIDIQNGEHDSIIDARVAMRLYVLNRKQWENDVRRFGNR